jgi:hypothetical protein
MTKYITTITFKNSNAVYSTTTVAPNAWVANQRARAPFAKMADGIRTTVTVVAN